MRFKIDNRCPGKSNAQSPGLKLVGMFIAANMPLSIGTSNPDKLLNQIKEMYPDAKLSKGKDYVQVEAK